MGIKQSKSSIKAGVSVQYSNTIKLSQKEYIIIAIGLLCSLLTGALAVVTGNFLITMVPVAILAIIIYLIFLFREPMIGLVVCIAYCFLAGILDREIGGLPYGTGNELFLILTWLSVWYNADKYDFKNLNNNLVWLTFAWFILSVMQIANPAGASPRGWLQEIRSTALYPLMITPLGILLINSRKRFNFVLGLFIVLSTLAALNGIKQAEIGLSPGEQHFLDAGGNVTHLIFGQLRAFSFYTDAGQFGASQAQFVALAIILAIGLKGIFKKIILSILSVIFFYAMLVSGTRGALFALIAGLAFAIIVSKNYRVMIVGGGLTLLGFFILKFTYIGNANYHVYRLRSAVDPQDASFNIRLINQMKLRDYLSTHPFGGGLGVIGHWGREYNPDKFLSTIPPDSYWVKVWAMYGIVGMIIFFCMWLYLFGKSIGMIWNMQDKVLRTKLTALIAGAMGIFICSYGNEVMNAQPSMLVMNLSMAMVYITCLKYIQEHRKNTPVIINV